MKSKRNRLIQQSTRQTLSVAVMAAITLFSACSVSFADEIRINENSRETTAGDFSCKPCYHPIINAANSLEMGDPNLTTGDLYRYFASRGIKKIDRLSLQVDVDCCPEEDQAFQLEQLNFKITGDDNTVLNDVSLQGDSLFVVGAEVSSFKSEAVLEFDLGYDFMERFSPDSTEAIELNYALPTSAGAMQPRFVLSEDLSSFSVAHTGILVLFVGFWVAVFVMMSFLVKPKDETLATAKQPANLVGS